MCTHCTVHTNQTARAYLDILWFECVFCMYYYYGIVCRCTSPFKCNRGSSARLCRTIHIIYDNYYTFVQRNVWHMRATRSRGTQFVGHLYTNIRKTRFVWFFVCVATIDFKRAIRGFFRKRDCLHTCPTRARTRKLPSALR